MGGADTKLTGPDLAAGVERTTLREGEPLLGHKDGEAILLVRRADAVYAVGATCTHYGGPLSEGLVVGDTVRCPWHHACFSLRTGEALAAPALNPLPWWETEVVDGVVRLGRKHDEHPLDPRGRQATGPGSVVIVGAGAAGSAAAETLRREGYGGRVVLVDPDPDAPYDRPNLSKDYLAGQAPEAWIPLRPEGFFEENGIERVFERATAIDRSARLLRLESGDTLAYGTLLLATGAVPRTPELPGADRPHVHVLRSLADCRGIIAAAGEGRRAVVVGAGFIGMEVAAALRSRGLEVTVVAPEEVPFARTFGPDLGAVLWHAHERHGVEFRLGSTIAAIESGRVVLDDGTRVEADLVIVGIGVRPDTRLAEEARLDVHDGVVVDEHLRTSDPRIFAAGDGARWPDPVSGEHVRVEHWVVAQRQGQLAARNMLGSGEAYRDVPFFWTVHFDVGVSYVGHAPAWDRVDVEGGPGDAAYRYVRDDRVLAVATIGRDDESLRAEVALASGRTAGPARESP